MEKVTKTCSRGHIFEKSSDCPVCPICWPGYYKTTPSDLPDTLSAPALRALLKADITSLIKISRHTEKELLALHGVGPSAIPKLRVALEAKRLDFKK